MSNDLSLRDTIVKKIQSKYDLGTLRPLSHFLGAEIQHYHRAGVLSITMKNKIRQLADDYKEYDLTPVDTPAITKKLNPGSSADDPGTAPLTSDYPYRQLLGSLSFIALNARPDIAYAVNQCARFANEPTVLCWQALTRILAYLVHTIDYAIVFRRDHKHTHDVEVYSDSDHMGSYNSKGELRSVTGYAIFHKGNLIAFKAQTQKRPSQSSSESELYAGVAACKQALYVQNLLTRWDPSCGL